VIKIPDIRVTESAESRKRSSTLFQQVSKRKGVLHLLGEIRENLDVRNNEILLLIIDRERPGFLKSEYAHDEDWAVYTQLGNVLGGRNITHFLEVGIRKLHKELFEKRGE